MKKEEQTYLVIGVVLLLLVVFLFQLNPNEISRCRTMFSALVRGSYSAQKQIDWEKLKALDVDVGATYSQFPDGQQRLNYQKTFVKSFALGFKQMGGELAGFRNWRVYTKDAEKTVIAADYRGQTLLLTFSKVGKKLTALQWK